MGAETIVPQQVGDIDGMLESFTRALRARNRSPRTIQSYHESVLQLAGFLEERGMPTRVAAIRREHVEAWIEYLLERFKPSTAAVRFRSVQQFFGYLVDEGEITESPMIRMRPPKVPEEPPPVLEREELSRLLATCEKGKTFTDRRDYAILRVFVDTGARLAEVVGLRWTPDNLDTHDVDIEGGVLRLHGKGARVRFVPVGNKTIHALDRYLRLRKQHRHPSDPALFLGPKGGMTESGIAQVVTRRAREAGLGDVRPHRLRHTFADQWLSAGGTEGGLRQIGGWRSRQMLDRYGASVATRRAIEEHRKYGPGDRL